MGIGAWSAAVFHFMIHAFFKALLFLSGGAVIHLLNDEHDIFRMGGLRKKLPVVFVTFLIGGASLSALPLITAGFYSKDQILWFGWSAVSGSHWLWLTGITGALLTSLYTFRLIIIAFLGRAQTEPVHKQGMLMTIPLIVLAFLSLVGGFIELPENIGPVHLFSKLFGVSLPEVILNEETPGESILQIVSAVVTIGGIWLAYRLFYKKPALATRLRESRINKFFHSGWGFDRIYDLVFVRPAVWLSEIDKKDFVDLIYTNIAGITSYLNLIFSRTQNGKLRWYVLILTIGLVVILAFMISL